MQLPILIRKGGFAHLRKTASFKAFKPMEQAVYSSALVSRKLVFDLACRLYRHAKTVKVILTVCIDYAFFPFSLVRFMKRSNSTIARLCIPEPILSTSS